MSFVDRAGATRSHALDLLERAVLTVAVISLFVFGYFAIGRTTDPARAHSLATPLDALIPFVAATIWIYLWVFPATLVPVFFVRCRDLFRRTVLAYAAVIVISLAVFAAFPVTSLGLRVDPAALDVTRFSPWAVSVTYALDPPFNLFPSLHLSTATIAAFSAWKARRSWGIAMAVGVALIGISICTVKQHFVVDGIAGVALAWAAYALFMRSYRPEPGTDPAYSWHGPALFFSLVLAVYLGLYVAFLRGA
jgi:membrane-associated phospholipid phosphatase